MLSPWEEILRLGGALLIGFLIGLEREISKKPAGLRTHMIISLASALFTMLSFSAAFGVNFADPTRIASQILTGMGFVGAGVIISTGGHVRGVTTAASLWITAAMGMAMGLGEYILALAAIGLTLLTLLAFKLLENAIGQVE
jgi:putative Mg2+ transporter-C (MgtC) family protein